MTNLEFDSRSCIVKMQNSLLCYLLKNKSDSYFRTYIFPRNGDHNAPGKKPQCRTGDIIAMGFKLSEIDVKAWARHSLATLMGAILCLVYFVSNHKAFPDRSSSCC